MTLPELTATHYDPSGQLGPDRYSTLGEQGAAATPGNALRHSLDQIEILRAGL